jgi:hypothetical protein
MECGPDIQEGAPYGEDTQDQRTSNPTDKLGIRPAMLVNIDYVGSSLQYHLAAE